jgi:hypothetical protein
MALTSFPLRALVSLLCVVIPVIHALKFDLLANSGHGQERCIRNFVNQDTLVVVTATISGQRGDGQVVNMHVCFYLMKRERKRDWSCVQKNPDHWNLEC